MAHWYIQIIQSNNKTSPHLLHYVFINLETKGYKICVDFF